MKYLLMLHKFQLLTLLTLIVITNAFPHAAAWQKDEKLGDLKTIPINRATDGDYNEKFYAYGALSSNIWSSSEEFIDDRSEITHITAVISGLFHGAGSETNKRSYDRGAEPEGAKIRAIDGRTYAFVGLERMGGVA